jgi:hypothetical protein
MSITKGFIAPVLFAAVAAGSIAIAPSALAENNGPTCTAVSSTSTQCQTPGNAQLTATPPYVNYDQQYPYFGGVVILDHHGRGGIGGHR